MHYYCTYFDSNYLIKGLTLLASIDRHEKVDFRLFIVCLDEHVASLLRKISDSRVEVVPLSVIEDGDQELSVAKSNRSLVEYYWTLTASIVLKVLALHSEIEILTYIDADMYFFDDPGQIFYGLGEASVMIHGHRFPDRLLHYKKYGTYNVGLMSFRNNSDGKIVLEDWRSRCNRWCHAHYDEGKFGDQAYLDDWPDKFPQVKVTQHIGVGTAPWNHELYNVGSMSDNQPHLDGVPLVVYHFHGMCFIHPGLLVLCKNEEYPLTTSLMRHIFLPYVRELYSQLTKVWEIQPDFRSGLTEPNVLNGGQTLIRNSDLLSGDALTNIPQIERPINRTWVLYLSQQFRDPDTLGSLLS